MRKIPEEAKKRPSGVTVLAVLAIIGGVMGLVGSAGFLVFTDMLPAEVPAWFFIIFGSVFLIIGILYFMPTYGFLKGKGWAWTVGIIASIIGIIITAVTTAVMGFPAAPPIGHCPISVSLGIIIPMIVIVYLTRPHVKEFFGKGVKTP